MQTVATSLFLSLILLQSCREAANNAADYTGWTAYAGTPDGMRYSSNDQINKGNVKALQLAWTYSTNDHDSANRSQNQCNPIVIDNILYGISPKLKLFALNASTGQEKWIFDPASEDSNSHLDPYAYYKVSRGLVYWEGNNESEKRILYSAGSRTYAINIADGKPIRSFGENGFIDLTKDLDRVNGSYNPFIVNTTPGVVFRDILIIGSRVAESADGAPGHIRGYDIRTGKRKWIFHTIPHPGETGYDSWPDKDAWKKLGGANSWAGMSLDEKRGIVYIPTGSIAGDFYGGFRKGTNLYANSLVALDAASGKYLWHFQTVHHDLWDRDLPANPNLLTVTHGGKKIDAVAQITKHGYIFLFDRENGNPLFPIQEKPVPTFALPGEEAWPTQPIPSLPEPFARQKFSEEDISDLDPQTYPELLAAYKKIKYSTMFTPPSKEGSWIFPGFDGGGEWGGAAVDPESATIYVHSSELPWSLTMIDVPTSGNAHMKIDDGKAVYNKYCISCHGPDLKGNGPSYPSLVDIDKRLNKEELRKTIDNGKNMMPSFKHLTEQEKNALLSYFIPNADNGSLKSETSEVSKEPGSHSILDEVPYTMTGYNRFLDRNGYPGIKPPWGTLNAVDLNTGKLIWKVPVGEYPELTRKGIPVTGTEGYGGPLVTKGGLVFIAASKDSRFRAFDKKTGKILWEAVLPVPGYATPATFMVDGVQYVVIACGGGKIGSPSGDKYLAFALPSDKGQ